MLNVNENTTVVRREYTVSFTKVQHGQRKIEEGDANANRPQPVGRVPRVARILALAHHFDRLIEQGIVKDYADIARLTQLSRARVAQIMTLKFLAPSIQEEIAWLPNSFGRDKVQEKAVRKIAMMADWEEQLKCWQKIL